MHRSLALAVLALLVLVALCGALPHLAAANPPPTAGTILTVAGNGRIGFSGDGGLAIEAKLNPPAGLATDRLGNLFIADGFNNRVRKVTPDGIISTVAGGGKPADHLGDGGPATAASLNAPFGLAGDADGNLFVGDIYNNRIREVSKAGIITTFAGNGRAGYAGDGGPATEARLNAPVNLALDRSGNLFIGDSWQQALDDNNTLGNNRIREVFGVAVPG
jgi:hypothetical protein